jgi:hypothetical protein
MALASLSFAGFWLTRRSEGRRQDHPPIHHLYYQLIALRCKQVDVHHSMDPVLLQKGLA